MASRKPVNNNDGLSATPFKPPLLEYWKPPKAVTFAPSVVKFNDNIDRNKQQDHNSTEQQQATFPSDLEETNFSIRSDDFSSGFNSIASSPGLDRRNKRFTWADSTTRLVGIKDLERTASLKSVPWGHDADWGKKIPRVSQREIGLSSAKMGGSPAYRIDDEDTLMPPWWQIQYWSLKKLIILGVGVAVTIAIVVAIAVEVNKKNAYPNYNSLNYTMVDQCQYSPGSV